MSEPFVSIIVPCYNEQSTIGLLLQALYEQTYPRSRMEVVIADGMSTDATREEIARFQNEHLDLAVNVVDNEQRVIPAALNCAIEAARGDVLVRLDGHSAPQVDYVERCVASLQQGRGDNVGGLWEIRPWSATWQARAVAAAAEHPFGVGDARYRVGGKAQEVDTVPFGAFYRSLVERVGRFDETLLTNEDYEFNTRVRNAGGRIWFDPSIRSTYYAKESIPALAVQYGRYGFWKARMLRRHPRSLRWRQALPPLFVLFLLALVVGAVLPGSFGRFARLLLAVQTSGYAIALLVAGAQAAWKKRDPALLVSLPLAIGTMHVVWGSAFLWSVFLEVIQAPFSIMRWQPAERKSAGIPSGLAQGSNGNERPASETTAIPGKAHKFSQWQLRIGERRALLIVGDLLIAVLALTISLYLWSSADRFGPGFSVEFLRTRAPTWFLLLPFAWLILLLELYDVHRAGDWGKTVRSVGAAVVLFLGLYLLLYFYYVEPPRNMLPRRGIASFLLSAASLTLLWRWVYIQVFATPRFMRRAILVGAGKSGSVLLDILRDIRPTPYYVVGMVDDDPEKQGQVLEGCQVIGSSKDLPELIQDHGVSDVIVAISGEMQGRMFQALLEAQERGVEITRMPVAYEELLGRVPIRLLEADWILRSFVDQARVNGFYELGKRLMDIVGGLIGLAVFLLVLPFVGAAILIDDSRPILYWQTRSGKGGQPYDIVKFRTMRRDAEGDGKPQWAKEDDERATRVGKFLRKSHLDELPQFWNVLRGDMSLVGPRAERPELVEHFQQYVPFYRARLMVKPGITGWAQVNFGYASSIDETVMKLEYDLYYLKHRNIVMDVLILLRTVFTMVGFRGR